MAYRQAAEMPGMNWEKAFSDFYKGRNDIELALLQQVLQLKDSYIPDAINNLTDADLPVLLELAREVEKLALYNSYYTFFAGLINKAIVLVLENFPEAFATLSAEEKEKIFGIKLEMPNEIAVFNQIYAYTQGREQLPYGTVHNGATMKSALDRAIQAGANGSPQNSQNKSNAPRIASALCGMDSQYNKHFFDTIPPR